MIDRYPELWTVPEISKRYGSSRERLIKIARHWGLGTPVKGKLILLKAEAEALAWLAKHAKYDGPPPWPPYVRYKMEAVPDKDAGLVAKYNLGVKIGGVIVLFAKDFKRLHAIRESRGRGLFPWRDSIKPQRGVLDTSRFQQYDTSQGDIKDYPTVPTRESRKGRKSMGRPKSSVTRSPTSVYLTPELKEILEKDIEKRPWMSLSALIGEIIAEYYKGVINGKDRSSTDTGSEHLEGALPPA